MDPVYRLGEATAKDVQGELPDPFLLRYPCTPLFSPDCGDLVHDEAWPFKGRGSPSSA